MSMCVDFQVWAWRPTYFRMDQRICFTYLSADPSPKSGVFCILGGYIAWNNKNIVSNFFIHHRSNNRQRTVTFVIAVLLEFFILFTPQLIALGFGPFKANIFQMAKFFRNNQRHFSRLIFQIGFEFHTLLVDPNAQRGLFGIFLRNTA